MEAFMCNCSHGTSDPRCGIARARRAALEEAHRLGREGKPLPSEKPQVIKSWGGVEVAKLIETKR